MASLFSLPAIALICFAALALAAAGCGLLLRDVATAVSGHGAGSGVQLGRLPTARDQRRPRSPIGRFDQWFYWLVVETGVDSSPLAALLAMVLTGVVAGAGCFLWQGDVIGAAWAGAAGLLLPLPWLMQLRRRNLALIQEQLPDVLGLLARAVRAGESVDQAIALAGEKSAEPLAKELRRCSHQLRMGLSLPAAMRSLACRVRTTDMRIFTAALAVHRQTGGNLALTLERMSHVVRERLAYRRQLRATTAAGRFSAQMVSLAGPLLFAYMFVFQYDYVGRLLDQSLGRSLLFAAAALELFGLIWISRMLREE